MIRRLRVLRGAGVVVAALGVAAALSLALVILPARVSAASAVPKTPIEHFVVLMQENHTFDNYFGTYPGADGIPKGAAMPADPAASTTRLVRPFHIGDRSILDLGHDGASATVAYNDGRMDGFIKAQVQQGALADLAMGYYDDRDVPYYWNMADRFVLFDRFFTSELGGSFLNHVYWVAAAPGNGATARPPEELRVTTIFDRLEQAGVSWKFYIQNYDPSVTYRTVLSSRTEGAGTDAAGTEGGTSQTVWCPLLNISRFLDDPGLNRHIVDLDEYYRDLRKGTLPAVAYIVPSGASEHPPGSLFAGQKMVRGLVNGLMASSAWDSSAFLLAYDDWGGWYDHVRPPRRDLYGNGFRVPALLVSPYARYGYIDHTTLDFTSILKFIEQNWTIRPLSRLDATAGSMMGAFDFDQAPREAAIIPLERGMPLSDRSVSNTFLYGLYGLASVVALLLIVVVAVRRRFPRRTLRWGGGVR